MFPITYSIIDIWKDDENLECTPTTQCITFPFLFVILPITFSFDILTFPFCFPFTFIKDYCNIKYDKHNLYDVIFRKDPTLFEEPQCIPLHRDDLTHPHRSQYLP